MQKIPSVEHPVSFIQLIIFSQVPLTQFCVELQFNEQFKTPEHPLSNDSEQPSSSKNAGRSMKPEIFVAVGLCTHLGCSPTFRPEVSPVDLGEKWKGGFFCPCHGSWFDLAGRVYRGVPAPTNLEVPPYRYVSDTRIIIGETAEEKNA